MITVRALDQSTFNVTVEGRTTTKHKVTVSPAYHKKLTGIGVSTDTLVKKSFEFLLEREPNTSILRSFDLSVISTYFPEYEKTIRKTLR